METKGRALLVLDEPVEVVLIGSSSRPPSRSTSGTGAGGAGAGSLFLAAAIRALVDNEPVLAWAAVVEEMELERRGAESSSSPALYSSKPPARRDSSLKEEPPLW